MRSTVNFVVNNIKDLTLMKDQPGISSAWFNIIRQISNGWTLRGKSVSFFSWIVSQRLKFLNLNFHILNFKNVLNKVKIYKIIINLLLMLEECNLKMAFKKSYVINCLSHLHV